MTSDIYSHIRRCERAHMCRGVDDCPLYDALGKGMLNYFTEDGDEVFEPSRHMSEGDQVNARMRVFSRRKESTVHLSGIKGVKDGGCMIEVFFNGGKHPDLYSTLHHINKEESYNLEPPSTDAPEPVKPARSHRGSKGSRKA